MPNKKPKNPKTPVEKIKKRRKKVVKNTGITDIDIDEDDNMNYSLKIKTSDMFGGALSDDEDFDNRSSIAEDDEEMDTDNAEVDNEDGDDIDDVEASFSDNDNDNECLYKHATMSDDSGDEYAEIYDDNELYQIDKTVAKDERASKPFITKYEKVRIISDRAKQLASGAKPMLKDIEHLSEREVSLLEFKHKVIPFIIVRTMPDGKVEHWKLNEFQNID